MGMAISVPRYTVEDLERFPEDGNRYELLDGMLLVTPAPNPSHQLVITRIELPLVAALMPEHAWVVGPGAIVLPPGTQLEPDILVLPARFDPNGKWREFDEHWLAVEVLSRSSKVYDRDFKRDAYFALGVRQVWLVDRSTKSVDVCLAPGETRTVHDVIRWSVPTIGKTVSVDLGQVFEGIR